MAKRRRSILPPFDGLPGLFDDLEIDLTRHDLAGDLIARHRRQATAIAGQFGHDSDNGDGLPAAIVPQTPAPTDRLMFISFGSGSSGNCAYLGNGSEGILIDAGIEPDKVKSELKKNGIDPKNISGIILTHDHSDHVRYAYQLLRKQKQMMLYATPRTLSGLLRRHSISSRIKDYHKPIYKEHPFDIGTFRITPFETSHDGTDNVGFHISFGQYHSFVVMTDSGCITDRSDFYIRQARYLMIESNYDAHMLAEGSYPEFLKARIASDRGHMDNSVTAEYLAKAYSPILTHIFLCHLSHDNNTPELALAATRSSLENIGISVGDASGSIEARKAQTQLYALPRFDSSTLFVFRERHQI